MSAQCSTSRTGSQSSSEPHNGLGYGIRETGARSLRDLPDTLEPYTYRIYAYFVLTILDDAAILAMGIF